MNILVVHNSLMDSTSISGVLKHYAYMAREWIAMGHQVDFLVAKAGFPQFKKLVPEAGLVSSDGLFDATRHLSKTWTYFPAYAWRCLTTHFLRTPRKYDIVYASGQFIVDVYCARVMARRHGCPWIAKVQHVLDSQAQRAGLINNLFLRTEKLAAKWMNREAARVMVLSNVVKRDYRALEEHLGLPPIDTVEVGCGIDVKTLQTTPASEQKHDVVFMGRMHEQKGVFDLPHVWKTVRQSCPNVSLLVIGEGPHRIPMQDKFAELGLKDGITFTGGIPEPDKNRYLTESRIGLSLSYEEGWGLSITEFLALGLPVAAYELPVFNQVFPTQLETAALGDRDGIARQIIRLLNEPEHARRRGEEGRSFAARYDYRHIAHEEFEILTQAVAQNGGVSPAS